MRPHSSSLPLEITAISADGLRLGDCRFKRKMFVIVRSGPNKYCTSKIDYKRGTYPSWDQKLNLELPTHVHSMFVEIKVTKLFGDVMVSKAEIPVSDLINDNKQENKVNLLSFLLTNSNGKRNGVINFAVRVGDSRRRSHGNGQPTL